MNYKNKAFVEALIKVHGAILVRFLARLMEICEDVRQYAAQLSGACLLIVSCYLLVAICYLLLDPETQKPRSFLQGFRLFLPELSVD